MDSLSGRCHPGRTGLLLSRRNFSLWCTGISLFFVKNVSQGGQTALLDKCMHRRLDVKTLGRITAMEDGTPFLLETVSHGGVDFLSVGECQPRRTGLPFSWRLSAMEDWTSFPWRLSAMEDWTSFPWRISATEDWTPTSRRMSATEN